MQTHSDTILARYDVVVPPKMAHGPSKLIACMLTSLMTEIVALLMKAGGDLHAKDQVSE